MTQATAAETPRETPKQASAPVIAQHAATLKALPFSDTRDFDDAKRGFLGTIENAGITNPQGRVVWTLEPYGFLAAEEAPAKKSARRPKCSPPRSSSECAKNKPLPKAPRQTLAVAASTTRSAAPSLPLLPLNRRPPLRRKPSGTWQSTTSKSARSATPT